MSKRIVICSDGTWNSPDQKNPTNVIKLARAVLPTSPDGTVQVVLYDQGVGTGKRLDRWLGGAFGQGLEKNVEDAYRFLMHNYDEGDEIFLFGFSRGAFTARSTVGMIRNCGLLYKTHADSFGTAYALYRERKPDSHPDGERAREFVDAYSRKVDVKFIGVWDTVGALGIPLRGLRYLTYRRHQFHDMKLSGTVKNAYHALAIDERRGAFKPSIWEGEAKPGQHVEQVWFSGVHSDIGGSYANKGLADLAFMWMKRKAEDCRLAFDEDYIGSTIHPNGLGILHNSKNGIYRFTRAHTRGIGDGLAINEAAHHQAVVRLNDAAANYRAQNLSKYVSGPDYVEAETPHGSK
jgi:uncharacterized protein (DUF2235 family)